MPTWSTAASALITTTSMASELNVLAHALNDLSESDRRSRDFTLNGLRKALSKSSPASPPTAPTSASAASTSGIGEWSTTAVAEARRRNPALEATIFDFVRGVLLPAAQPAEAAADPDG